MSIYELHDPLFRILERMKYASQKARAELLINAALETGTLIKPEPGNTMSARKFEISAHKVWARGANMDELPANWMRAARTSIEFEHGEVSK